MPADTPRAAPALPDLEPLRAALIAAYALKSLPRAGWLRVGVARPESVAAHTWGLCWLVLALCPPHLDRGRALAIATLHDLAEATVGDITPHDGIDKADKQRREAEALRALVAPLPDAAALEALWWDYEEGHTPEGRWVKALDKLDMALQAADYAASDGIEPSEFIDSALARLEDPLLRALAAGSLASDSGGDRRGSAISSKT